MFIVRAIMNLDTKLSQIFPFFIHLLLVGSFRSLNNWKLNAASFKVKRLNIHRLGNYDYGHTTQLNFGFKRPIWVLIGQFQAYPVLKISTIIKIEQQKNEKWMKHTIECQTSFMSGVFKLIFQQVVGMEKLSSSSKLDPSRPLPWSYFPSFTSKKTKN